MDLNCMLHTLNKMVHADNAVKLVISNLFAKSKNNFPIKRKTNAQPLKHRTCHVKLINQCVHVTSQYRSIQSTTPTLQKVTSLAIET